MSTAMPTLESERLIVRPLEMRDLEAVHDALSAAWGIPNADGAARLEARERWLRWTVAGYEQLASLNQPPYGERAVVLKGSGSLVGCVGLVPSLGPFGQLPGFPAHHGSRHWNPEIGLYWAVEPRHQRRGYAAEAAGALIRFIFDTFRLGRVVATTAFDNAASIAVMRKLGMRILRNPLPAPSWFQIVGLLEREDGPA